MGLHTLTFTCAIQEIGFCRGSVQKHIDQAKAEGRGYLIATVMEPGQPEYLQELLDNSFTRLATFKNDYTYHKNDGYMITLMGLDLKQPGTVVAREKLSKIGIVLEGEPCK